MSAPELYGGIGSLVVGLLFVSFPRFIGTRFNWIGRLIEERHQDDISGKIKREIRKSFPAYSPDFNDDDGVPKKFRILGVIFLIQAVVFFILSAVMPTR